ncbi:MAG: hypothetical protein ACTSP4_03060, partial [Candidatus Hodarchaeales archaeon]
MKRKFLIKGMVLFVLTTILSLNFLFSNISPMTLYFSSVSEKASLDLSLGLELNSFSIYNQDHDEFDNFTKHLDLIDRNERAINRYGISGLITNTLVYSKFTWENDINGVSHQTTLIGLREDDMSFFGEILGPQLLFSINSTEIILLLPVRSTSPALINNSYYLWGFTNSTNQISVNVSRIIEINAFSEEIQSKYGTLWIGSCIIVGFRDSFKIAKRLLETTNLQSGIVHLKNIIRREKMSFTDYRKDFTLFSSYSEYLNGLGSGNTLFFTASYPENVYHELKKNNALLNTLNLILNIPLVIISLFIISYSDSFSKKAFIDMLIKLRDMGMKSEKTYLFIIFFN